MHLRNNVGQNREGRRPSRLRWTTPSSLSSLPVSVEDDLSGTPHVHVPGLGAKEQRGHWDCSSKCELRHASAQRRGHPSSNLYTSKFSPCTFAMFHSLSSSDRGRNWGAKSVGRRTTARHRHGQMNAAVCRPWCGERGSWGVDRRDTNVWD